jgi:uncharacterized membrane protein/DNA-binding MarR family transcriptional regulator
MAEDGDYWAVPDGDEGFDIHRVHGADGGTLPIILPVPGGVPTAVWIDGPTSGPNVWQRNLDGDGLGEISNIAEDDGSGVTLHSLRASDLATVLNGGCMAVGTFKSASGTIHATSEGTLEGDVPSILITEVAPPVQSASSTTDVRGQTYVAHADPGYDDGLSVRFWISDRAPDTDLHRPASVDPMEPVLLRAGTTLETTVLVESLVGYPATIRLAIAEGLSTPFGAEIVGDDLIEMEGGSTARVTVRLIASMTAATGARDTVTVTAHPEGWPEAIASIHIPVEVPEHHPFIVRGPDEALSALPGEPIPVTLTLESWSDSDETVTVELEVPRGWSAEAPAPLDVPSGETVELEVEVTAPEGTAAGTEAVIKVTGTTSDGEVGAGALLAATVVPHTGVALDLGEGRLEVSPTTATSLEAMVRNTGNEPVTVQMYAQPSEEGWKVEVSDPDIHLTPGSQAPVLVWVTAPEGATYQTPARVMVVAASEEGPTLAVGYFRDTVGLKVEYEGLFMPMSVPLMEGTAVTDLVLNNKGNSFEQLSISFLGLPDGWRAKAAGVTGPIILGPGESRTLKVTITAPRDALPGRVPVAVQVRGSTGFHSSWCDVHVPQAFDVELVMEETTRTLTPPSTVTFPFEMRSVGNSGGTARLALEGLPYGWDYSFRDADGEPTVNFPLGLGDQRTASLVLKVPPDADGDHAIDMVLWSEEGGQLLRQVLYLRLRFPDLTVVDLTIHPYEPRAGAPMTVRATVLNLGMADAEDVTVVLRDGTTVMDRDTLSIVPRLGQLEVVLYMVPERGHRTLVLQVDPSNEIRERDEANNLVKRHLDVAGAQEETVPPAVVQVSVAAVTTASIIGLVVTGGGPEPMKYALWTLVLLPLYTKIKKDRVLDHYLRGKIHGYIIANPGEHYNAIKEQLDVTNGALSYHLRVLEREGYVRSRMDGIYKRFYPADMKLPRTQRNISSFQEVILTIVKNNQGLSQKDIAKRIGASSQVINYHVKIMEESGLIRVDRTRRKSRVFATDTPATVPVPVD